MAKKTASKRKAPEEAPTFNIADHVLVPKHEVCSDAERKRVLSQYGITAQQLPRILINDPAIRHLGVQEGDVIKISRKSPTAGATTFYRVVTAE